VLAADTGVALKKISIDVFMGEGRIAAEARELYGVESAYKHAGRRGVG